MAGYRKELNDRLLKLKKELEKMEAKLTDNYDIDLFNKYKLKLIDYKTVKSRIANLGKSVVLGNSVKENNIIN